jgi:hypothetical protein
MRADWQQPAPRRCRRQSDRRRTLSGRHRPARPGVAQDRLCRRTPCPHHRRGRARRAGRARRHRRADRADVPANEYGLIMPDQPVLCGPGSTPQAANCTLGSRSRGAWWWRKRGPGRGRRHAVQLDYTPLPVVTDPFAALQPGAPPLHPTRSASPTAHATHNSNLLLRHICSPTATSPPALRGRCGRRSTPIAPTRRSTPICSPRPGGLCAPGWPHRSDLRRPVDARGARARSPTRWACPLSRSSCARRGRRCVWRARGYFGADRAGPGRVEDGTAGQDCLEPRGEHRRPSQAPPGTRSRPSGAPRAPVRSSPRRWICHQRLRRLRLHQHKVLGNIAHVAARPLCRFPTWT